MALSPTNPKGQSFLAWVFEIMTLVVGWYVSSIIASNTSKQLLQLRFEDSDASLRIDSLSLTCAQLWISALCGFILIYVFRLAKPRSLGDNTTTCSAEEAATVGSLRRRMWTLGLVFMGGFITLNLALESMSVSLANTLRALEPIVSLFLSYVMINRASVTLRLVGAVIPIVVGAAMASYGNAEFTIVGFMVLMLSNFFFALRTVLYKRIRQSFGLDNITMFYHICIIGAMTTTVLLITLDLTMKSENPTTIPLVLKLVSDTDLGTKLLVFGNGACFFAYLQLSFVVLSKVTVVTHAVANAFRRPAVIIASIIQFQTEISFINGLGIAIACAGVLFYSWVKSLPTGSVSGDKLKAT